MNCKKGDLAIVISGEPNVGKLVACLCLLQPGAWRDDLPPGVRQQISPDAGPLWRVDRPIGWGPTGAVALFLVPDQVLMPIRPLPDGDGSLLSENLDPSTPRFTVCD